METDGCPSVGQTSSSFVGLIRNTILTLRNHHDTDPRQTPHTARRGPPVSTNNPLVPTQGLSWQGTVSFPLSLPATVFPKNEIERTAKSERAARRVSLPAYTVFPRWTGTFFDLRNLIGIFPMADPKMATSPSHSCREFLASLSLIQFYTDFFLLNSKLKTCFKPAAGIICSKIILISTTLLPHKIIIYWKQFLI